MTTAQAVIAYVIAWWMVLLMAAPVASHKTNDKNRKNIWIVKILSTTVVSGLITWGVALFIDSGMLQVK